MDYLNIDMQSPYETDQNILTHYSIDRLLLEISCNMRDISKEAIIKHANKCIDDTPEDTANVLEP